MPKVHQVRLTDDERRQLDALTRQGVAPARHIRRARILVLAADGRTDVAIADAVGCCVATVENVRRRFATGGVAAARHDRPRPGAQRQLDGTAEAFLVALACSAPPAGRDAWTMHLLADRLVELGAVARISDETVRRTRKKTRASRGSGSRGVCRP